MATTLSTEEQKTLNFVRLNPGCTSNEVAIMMEKTNPSAWYMLNKLVEKGCVHRNEAISENGRHEYKYYLGGTVHTSDSGSATGKADESTTSETTEDEKPMQTERLDSKRSYQTIIVEYVKQHPKCTSKQIVVDLNLHTTTASNNLYKLEKDNIIKNVSDSHTKLYVFNDNPEQAEEQKTETETKSKPVPRELMLQLKALGYSGIIKRTVEKTFDFEKLTVEQLKKFQEQGYTGRITIKKKFDINLDKLN